MGDVPFAMSMNFGEGDLVVDEHPGKLLDFISLMQLQFGDCDELVVELSMGMSLKFLDLLLQSEGVDFGNLFQSQD